MNSDILLWIIGVIVPVLGWFLRNKDEQQAGQIKMLFEKHDADASALQELRVQIASKHYERDHVDGKIDKIERTIRDGMTDLGAKFDKLADALTAHLRDSGK
jgi:hypothetical protein